MPDPRLPGPGAGYPATRARCRMPGRPFFGILRKRPKRPVFDSKKHFQQKICWSIFFFVGAGFPPVGAQFPPIWAHSKPPGNGFQPPGTVLVSFGTVRKGSNHCGRLSTNLGKLWQVAKASGQLADPFANGIPLDPMEFHWIQWNSMEWNVLER